MSDDHAKLPPRVDAHPTGGGIIRRSLLRNALFGGVAVALPLKAYGVPMHHGATTEPSDVKIPQTPPLQKFVDALPRPATAIPDPSVYPGADYYEMTMREDMWQFHRDLRPTKAWGYWTANPQDAQKPVGMGYLGPTISVTKDHPTVIKYSTELPTTHMFQWVVDLIRSGDPQLAPIAPHPYHAMAQLPPDVNVWNVVHQHGGFTAPQSDGLPLQSFSPTGVHARSYSTLEPSKVKPNEAMYAYTNRSPAAMLWYHDHAMGLTSLNVYAGLAGLWLVRDPEQEKLGLPSGEFEVPIILQDRTFNADGSLAYTMTEREGEDTPVVNGKAYPFLAVEPRRYRLRFLNGSNARFFRLQFLTPRSVLPQPWMPFWLIGTDSGLRTPLQMLNFLIAPAERYDVIIDFSHMPMGTKITLMNYNAPVHFPDGEGPQISEVMQFQVTKQLSAQDDTAPPEKLHLPTAEKITPMPETRRREWVVYQHQLFSTMTLNAVPFEEPSQDFIKAGSTEIWEFVNPNHDAHPMHVHLVWFEVLNRQPIDAAAYQADYEKWLDGGRKDADRPVLDHYLSGPPIPPDPDENGSMKDTVKAYPEMVTRIIINQFNPPTETIASIPDSGTEFPAIYVTHCHILEHEDDDMMRPWSIIR